MKELSIQEKAKRYDEALERAKNFIENGDEGEKTIAESIFAGIMEESEDEKVRQLLMRFVKYDMPDNYSDDFSKEDCLAWLEKRGEKGTNGNNREIPNSEQKPTEKVEPKFKVGDIIRPKGSTKEYTIESISGGCYCGDLWRLPIGCDDDYELVKQNNAWSEEDESNLDSAIYYIRREPYRESDVEPIVDWLRHLKERYTWKPSGEQMKILNEVLNFAANHESPHWNDYIFGTLNNLIRQLKKL